MRSRRIDWILLCGLTLAAAGCGDDSPTEPRVPAPTRITLQSDAGDYIGAGQSYDYTKSNAVIEVTAATGRLSVNITGDENWFGEFQGPSGQIRLTPGTYTNLQRYPFHDASKGGLSWSGEGRGCNTLTGSFTVDTARYDIVTGNPTAIDLRFEQHCEGGAPALRGTIHWRAADSTAGGPVDPEPGPVVPIPGTLWRPPAGATPATGNFVYLNSESGDYIGQGLIQTYTPANATISATAIGNRVAIGVGGAQSWSGDFQAMRKLTRLEVGYYPDLQRYPFHNPVKGGLSWFGEGRGCNTLQGWFAVDRVTYSGDELTAIELRFEQRCEGGVPALRGAIRWTR